MASPNLTLPKATLVLIVESVEVEVSELVVFPEELTVVLSEELSSDLAQDSIRPRVNARKAAM